MLRNYQEQAVFEFENCKEKNIVLQMPTGAGKTFTFTEIAKRHFIEHVNKVLIIVHRTELMNQAKKSLGERCFLIEKGVKNIPNDYDYYIAMVETLNRRIEILPSFGLVIIDECHIGNFKKLPFFTNENTKVLGVSATPISEPPLIKYYDKIIIPTSINYLIENNYLLNCDVYAVASDDVKKQNFKTVRGDYDEKELDKFYSSEKMVLNVLNAYWKFSAGKKTLIFNVNLNHNDIVFNSFINEGLNVYKITGETPIKEREEIIHKFKTQNDAILCNVGVFTTGFDEPSIKTIVLNRATKSLPLYLQMIGRGSRIYDNKEKFTVIDLGRNTKRHGFYDKYHDWQNYFEKGSKKKNDKEGAMPIKECSECGFTLHTRIIICPNCGHDFQEEREKQEKEEKEKEFILLQKEKPINIPFERLFELAEQKQWKPYAVIYKINDHILNYQNKNRSLVTDDYCTKQALDALEIWCKKYEKVNNKWHKDFITEKLNEKRRENSAGNSNVLSQ